MEPPFTLTDPDVWSRVVDAAQPASLLVAIGSRLGADLRQRITPEDIWQETMLRAWQGRASFAWQGTPAFRRWLLCIAERCIADLRDHEHAAKRDVGRTVPMAWHSTDGQTATGAEPHYSTTPSRLAIEKERARAMRSALDTLPEELREVVRLRLFEDLEILEIAQRLGLGESGVRHRFRRGAEQYREALRLAVSASSLGVPPQPAGDGLAGEPRS